MICPFCYSADVELGTCLACGTAAIEDGTDRERYHWDGVYYGRDTKGEEHDGVYEFMKFRGQE